MALSDSFYELADQTKKAEDNVQAAASPNKAELQAKVKEARKRADEQSAQLHAKAEQASDRAKSGWQEVQDDRDAHVQRIRQRIDAKKAEMDRSGC